MGEDTCALPDVTRFACKWVGTGRTAGLCFPIPPVVTVRATFTAHGDRLRGFPAFRTLLTWQGCLSLRIQQDDYSHTSQAVALPPVYGFPVF